ncbi:PadR family transcriptional regulator [Nocardioides daphniae]|uniref:Transcriptional regulator n=1 Tax=Nocardioides daphniae TaxID=402297 RepID=A0A4P7UA50_9ACTN|nr:PadR family transcriptional regulator [Nocardioides daphniae]QCC76175.1 PadR family transcriptional regulator [Nocardioides daphniae]GGD09354.1 transcriptional regulator [Nocardioides daphniae]
MSIKQSMLALLQQGPMYGYQLRSEFEERTGSTWPLNIGQVYTTLTRLERDGLIEVVDTGHGEARGEAEGATDGAGERQVSYRLTEAGAKEADSWFTSPVPRTQPPRDELAIKLALAVTLPGVDIGQLIQRQRAATMAALQEHTRAKRSQTADPASVEGLALGLVLDSLVFDTEAEIRWLDHCESRLRRAAAARTATPTQEEDR